MFSILIHRKALKEIGGLPPKTSNGFKGLKGLLRRRVGDYRIAFTINFEKTEVIILRIGRRAEFY
jgi:mRNA-degrading endonuclease RelE of RelBE toxin-antitoxin system